MFCFQQTHDKALGRPAEQSLDNVSQMLADNLTAATAMGAKGLIVHVGSHLGAGLEVGLDAIAAAIGTALDEVPDGRLLLENSPAAPPGLLPPA